MIRSAAASDAGLQRDQNEDRFLVDQGLGIFCVIDGVGGHAGGERAAAIAHDLLATRLARETGTAVERLREAIALANNAIFDEAQRNATLAGMTCVLTAALLSGERLTIGHVGDTRLYKIRQGRIQKLTRDHSPVGEREDAGDLTETEAMRHPRRNEVYRDVGAGPHAPDDEGFVDLVETVFEPDAVLVLCSDGLSDQVSSASIRRIVEARAGDPPGIAAELVRAANDAGGKDNVTVVVVEGAAVGVRSRGAAVGPGATVATERAPRVPSLARMALVLCLGVVLGLLGGLAAVWMLRPDILRQPLPITTTTPSLDPPRTWRVGLDAEADAATIGDALERARDGDTIALAPGDYREALVIVRAVAIDGARDAVIRPPLGAASSWTAVHVRGNATATLSGFTIAGSSESPLAVGIHVEAGEATIRRVAISGAAESAIRIGPDGSAAVAESTIHDNPGTGVTVARGARLSLVHSSLLRNGTIRGRPRPGVELSAGADATFTGNAIGDNGGAAIAGLPPEAAAVVVRDNLVRPLLRVPARAVSPAAAPRGAAPGSPR